MNSNVTITSAYLSHGHVTQPTIVGTDLMRSHVEVSYKYMGICENCKLGSVDYSVLLARNGY